MGNLLLHEVMANRGLSNREREVAELVAKGLSNKEAANRMFVTEKTIKFHLTNIYKKLNVKSRAQLIVWAMPHMKFEETELPRQSIELKTEPIIGDDSLPFGKVGPV